MRSLITLTNQKLNLIRAEAQCSITSFPTFEAATLSTCGHTFEFRDLQKYLLQYKQACPLCNKPATAADIYLNSSLMKLLDAINTAYDGQRLFEVISNESIRDALDRNDQQFLIIRKSNFGFFAWYLARL